MALFRKFFYKKPPDGLLEISERVYVFDCCFSTNILGSKDYRIYLGGIVSQLKEHLSDASFMVFNFWDGENQSQIANILSDYDMIVMDYPKHYEGCPLLTMEMIHHFLRSSESWLSLSPRNTLMMNCEAGGWPVLAFMLAALLIYRKQYTGEEKALEMIYKQAPRELLNFLSPLNPLPSQLRYLQYISRRNVASEWPPLDRALTLDCIILRNLPNFDGEFGCRPIFRIYGQDPFIGSDRTPKVLFSTPKRSEIVRHYKQKDCELVKIDINCHIQGDIVLECISLDENLEREVMMFRIMFNTAFIRSNILIVNRDEIDILWNSKENFPKDFKAELLLSDMNLNASYHHVEFASDDVKEGLSMEAFSKVQEFFNNVDWLYQKGEARNQVLQQITSLNLLSGKMEESSNHNNSSGEHITKQKSLTALQFNTSREAGSPTLPSRSLSGLTSYFLESPQPSRHSAISPLPVAATNSASKLSVFDTTENISGHISSNSPSFPNISIATGSQISSPLHHSSPSLYSLHLSSSEKILQLAEASSLSLSSSSSSLTSYFAPEKPFAHPPPPPPLPPPPFPPPSSNSRPALVAMPLPSWSVPNSASMTALMSTSKSMSNPQMLNLNTKSMPQPPTFSPVSIFESISQSLSNKSMVPPPPPPPASINELRILPSMLSFSAKSNAPPPPPPPPPPTPISNSELRSTSMGPTPPPPPPPPPTSKSESKVLPPMLNFSGKSISPPPPPPISTVDLSSRSMGPTPPPPPNLSPHRSHVFSPNSPPVPPPPLPSGPLGCPKVANQNIPAVPSAPLGSPGSAKNHTFMPAPGPKHALRQHSLSRKTSLKPLHWIKVTRVMQGSIWADTQKQDESSKAPDFDMFELESLFSATPAGDVHNSLEKSKRGGAGPKSDKVHLVDLRRANNCEIMLTKVKIPLPDLISSLLALDDSVLDIDQVDNLIKFCPTKEEIDLLKGFNGDKENLGKCEQFFLELMKVPRVESKLRVFSFKIQFHSQVSDLRSDLNTVNKSSDEIRNSSKLKRIMQTILSLGNALNQGTARGSAVGFRLDSLLKLSETRARNNKTTLMHYLCKVLAEKLPELLDFNDDLVSLEAASKVQLKTLAEEMQAVTKGLAKVEQELTASENDGPVSQNFCQNLKGFLVTAEAEVRSLTSLYSGVGRNADALAIYFGEDPVRCPYEQVVSTLLLFVRMFRRAHEENRRQIELESRKSSREREPGKIKVNARKKDPGRSQ